MAAFKRRVGHGRFSARSLSDKAGDESDEISPVVECFVIDWTTACRLVDCRRENVTARHRFRRERRQC
jgi:hypothetical protein